MITIELFTRVRVMQLERQVAEMRKRHDAEMRAKDEAISDLITIIDHLDDNPAGRLWP